MDRVPWHFVKKKKEDPMEYLMYECEAGVQRFIYLAGDSSLDNKHWYTSDEPHRTLRNTSRVYPRVYPSLP